MSSAFFQQAQHQLDFTEDYVLWQRARGSKRSELGRTLANNWNVGYYNTYINNNLPTDSELFRNVYTMQQMQHPNNIFTKQFDSQTLSNAAEQHIHNISDLRTAQDAQHIFYTVLQAFRYSDQEHLPCCFEPLRAKLPQLAEDFLNNPLTRRFIPEKKHLELPLTTAQHDLFESINVNSREEFIGLCSTLAADRHSEQSAPQLQ